MSITLQEASGCVSWNVFPDAAAPDRADSVREILLQARISYDLKADIMRVYAKHTDAAELMAELQTLQVPASLCGAILEILTEY